MPAAYIDSSALLAIAFDERGAVAVTQQLTEHTRLVSPNLLEAKMRAAFAREGRGFDDHSVYGIEWVLPERPLAREIRAVLDVGYLRGADVWHLASALYATREMGEVAHHPRRQAAQRCPRAGLRDLSRS